MSDTAAANPYGSPPGTGITMPPYYRPTPSVRNRNTYFPQSEPLGPEEMRIIVMGSNPWPPRIEQAATCMMVELGGEQGTATRLFFDFGPGCLRNIIGHQVPVPEIDNIFLSHLHIDHFGDLPYLWQFAPFNGRWTPLRVIGPSGRTPELGTAAMCEHLTGMGAWTAQWAVGPMADGYRISCDEFDFRDDGGVCFDRDGVRVIHWRRSHGSDGASAYRLDWNGLSFVWTGDGKPDRLTEKYAAGADVFVSELACDLVNLWSLKQGVSPLLGAYVLDNYHTTHYGVGYLAERIQPRLAMATHLSFDRELIGEILAGIRSHYRGLFAFGVDNVVVNVTKDAIWIRDAALPETGNIARADTQWLVQHNFGGTVPGELLVDNPVVASQERSVRDLEIDPDVFTPADQIRPQARSDEEQLTIRPAQLMGLE
jgi:ribonuclease Z